MTTPRLGMTEWTENQNQPHVPVNGMIRTLEVFASLVIVQAIQDEPSDSFDQEDGDVFIVSPTPLGDWDDHPNEIAYYSNGLKFIVPFEGTFAFNMDTEELLVFSSSDGWTVTTLGDPTVVAQPYVVGATFNGVPSASQVIMRHPVPIDVDFATGLPDSQGFAEIAATATTDFDIQKNGVSIGTMRFAAAGTVATFIFAGDVSFVAGDVLTVIAPASPDATLADFGLSLLGER